MSFCAAETVSGSSGGDAVAGLFGEESLHHACYARTWISVLGSG